MNPWYRYTDDGSHCPLGLSYMKSSLSMPSLLLSRTVSTAAPTPSLGVDGATGDEVAGTMGATGTGAGVG